MKEIMGLKRNFIIFNPYFPIPTVIAHSIADGTQLFFTLVYNICHYNVFIPLCHLQYIHPFLSPTMFSSLCVTYNIFIPFCHLQFFHPFLDLQYIYPFLHLQYIHPFLSRTISSPLFALPCLN